MEVVRSPTGLIEHSQAGLLVCATLRVELTFIIVAFIL
jgi:hypothetical protein